VESISYKANKWESVSFKRSSWDCNAILKLSDLRFNATQLQNHLMFTRIKIIYTTSENIRGLKRYQQITWITVELTCRSWSRTYDVARRKKQFWQRY